MTIVVVLAEPPWLGLVLSELAETSPPSEAEAADLCTAMLRDVCIAVERSDSDLFVNYRAGDELPDELAEDHNSETEIRSVIVDVLGGTDDVRFEPQADSTFSAHASNTVSHLLNEEGEAHSATVVQLVAPLLGHTHLDSAAMKLRNTPVVLGPSTEGHAYFSDFPDPINFINAYAGPEVETLTHHTDDANRSLDYVLMLPVLETDANLTTVVPMLRSQAESERPAPGRTTTLVFEEGLRVESTNGVLESVRD